MQSTKQEIIDKAVGYFTSGYACSQSVLLAFADEIKLDKTLAKRISGTFGGGMGRLRQKCGALTGGFMVLGLVRGYEEPSEMDKKMSVYKDVRELNRRFETHFEGLSNCNELIVKYSTPEHVKERSHHKDICVRAVEAATAELYDMLNS